MDRAIRIATKVCMVLAVLNLVAFIVLLYIASLPQVDMGEGSVPACAGFVAGLLFVAAGLLTRYRYEIVEAWEAGRSHD